MTFIWQFTGAMFAVAGAVLALTISTIAFYIVAVAIQSTIEERKKKSARRKKNNKKGKK